MKVKDIVEFLNTLDQEAEVWVADYYYSDREGFAPETATERFLSCAFVRSADWELTAYYDYPQNVILFDMHGV